MPAKPIHSPAYRILITAFLILLQIRAGAWVYFEHREIGLLAIESLSRGDRDFLQAFWAEARLGYEGRLTDSVIMPGQGRKPVKLDYASWFAIGGDHSCSPQDLLNIVLRSSWILPVADISAELKFNMDRAKNNSQRMNYLHMSDIKLQRADPDYATRAGTNNVHFLQSRPDVSTSAAEYIQVCIRAGGDLNALGAYAWFHISAVMKAARYANNLGLTQAERAGLALSALADEAFAIHFLEDAFAAGHIAGTWGKTSVRKGTHDYYNEKGLEVTTWNGKHLVLMGDAFMRPEDAAVASVAVAFSLEQLVAAGRGELKVKYETDTVSLTNQADSFSVCTNMTNISRQVDGRFVIPVVAETPVPGLANGLGELPRFRSELGTYVGISAAINSSLVFGGFGKTQDQTGDITGLGANFRFGFGLEGVLDQGSDASAFLQVGWRLDGASTSQILKENITSTTGSITAAIPGRTAFNFRVRMPFYLIPGDLLLAGPILFLFSPKTAVKMGVVAANGGLIPWQSPIATPIGRFQFILGREVGISFYGHSATSDQLLVPDETNSSLTFIQYQSTQFDFPVIEYIPLRSFTYNQSSSLGVQLTVGFDVPHNVEVLSPAGAPAPPLKTLWQAGLRIIFNWRHYL